ncbi:MAG: substrate-binding domain-containing protein [Oscillospiraceae bacterium]|jgi:ABC-type sugar transport system substrate-binding protein|nr:substrate-binding domain-containing protein [Oscillospiraceae bacterium]
MMKRAVSIIIACLMLASLFACGTKADNQQPSSDSPTGSAPAPTEGGAGDGGYGPFASAKAADGMGFFNPDFDYSTMPKYKVAFLSMSWSTIVQQFSDAYEIWAQKTNVEYTKWESGNDVDAMMVNIETQANQGIDGVILNVFVTDIERAAEVATENGLFWIGNTDAPRGSDGKLIAPYAGLNFNKWGNVLMKQADQWCKDNFSDYDPATSRVLIMTFSPNIEFNERQYGMEEAWAELYPDLTDNLYVCDNASQGNISPDITYDLVATQMAAYPDTSHWIILGVLDWISAGGVRAAEQYGVEDRTCLATCGGEDYVKLLVADQTSCWRFTSYQDISTLTNSIYNGLYAMIAGWAKPEELWSDYVLPGDTFANLYLAFFTVDADNYEQVFAYSDHLSGFNWYPDYAWDGQFTYPLLDSPSV